MAVEKVTIREAVIDPKWTWGELIIDGHAHIFLRLEHPQHGFISTIVPREVARSMGAAMIELGGKTA